MKLYNSLSQTKEVFVPNNDRKVTLYVCGITPYDTTHLGHAFTYLTFDILQRFLTFQGYTVTYTQNVTDIDDDILKKAHEVGKDWQELGEFWTKKFLNDLNDLNVIMPTFYVKATDSIPTILEIVEKLIEKKLAYEKSGNVYFRVKSDPDYGKLSKFSREEMIKLSKERGADPADPNKEDPLDFILWQKSKEDEPSWNSKWARLPSPPPTTQASERAGDGEANGGQGKGRPGWHIECSAMIYKYLDKKIDIHGGGIDLIYPHHESEIAQSENFTGEKPFVKYWLHTGAVGYQGHKMSKSLGNLVMVSDLLKKYPPNAIRYLLLSHHYRQPWEFKEEELITAAKSLKNLLENLKGEEKGDTEGFIQALSDDLDTPKALKVMEEAGGKTLLEMLLLLGFII